MTHAEAGCWVLVRAPLRWHLLPVPCPGIVTSTEPLYGHTALCGELTPNEPTDVLAFTTAPPRAPEPSMCTECVTRQVASAKARALSVQ